MINYKSFLFLKGNLYTKCMFQYFLPFFLVITSIPSTFALKVEIFGPPFADNPNYPFFQSLYGLITSFLIPIVIRETFNCRSV